MREFLDRAVDFASSGRQINLIGMLAFVFLARLVVGGWLLFPDNEVAALYHDNWANIAETFLQGFGFRADPSASPDLVRGPMFVMVLSGLFYFFGVQLWPVMVANWLFDVVTGALLYLISLQLFPKQRLVALIAVFMWALYVPEIAMSTHALSESFFTAVLAGHIYSLLLLRRSPSIRIALVCGLLLGVAMMTRSTVQLWPIAVWGLLLIDPEQPFRVNLNWMRGMLPSLVVLSIAYATVITPWALRNLSAYGEFTPGTVSAGKLLFEDHWLLDQERSIRVDGLNLAPEWEPALRSELEKRGEDYPTDPFILDRTMAQLGFEKIQAYPLRYVEMCLYRVARFWFNLGYGHPPSSQSYMVAALNGVVLTLAIAAYFIGWSGGIPRALPLLAIVGYFMFIHSMLFATVRYSFPIIPYVLIFSAYTMASSMIHLSRVPTMPKHSPEATHV